MRNLKKWFRYQLSWEGKRRNRYQLETALAMLIIVGFILALAIIPVVTAELILYG